MDPVVVHHVLLLQYGGDVAGQSSALTAPGLQHHPRDAWVAGQCGQPPSGIRDSSVGIYGFECPQLVVGLPYVGLGRRSQPRHGAYVGLAEICGFQHHWREVSLADFGASLFFHAMVGGQGPQPVAHAW